MRPTVLDKTFNYDNLNEHFRTHIAVLFAFQYLLNRYILRDSSGFVVTWVISFSINLILIG